ncbi:MAG TPA: ASKHA domain-containing protein [Thermoplasmata archaeon]
MEGIRTDRGHVVRFAPDGRSAVVETGTTILDASRMAGVTIDAVCGGEGKCGRCKVRPEGRFSSLESSLISGDERAAGIVLACKATVEGDLSVEVLPRSLVGKHQILTKSIEEVQRPLSPWVRKEFLTLPKATIWDNIADLERLWRALGISGLPMPLETLRGLPNAIRAGDWQVTVTLSTVDSIDEITRVESGDRSTELLGVAADIGTTTVVTDLVDLLDGTVIATASDYNRQVSRGEDVIARMMFSEEGGSEELTSLVRETIGSLISRLVVDGSKKLGRDISGQDIVSVSVAGNTIMTHFYAGLPTKHLRLEPYVPVAYHTGYLKAAELDLKSNSAARVLLFPSRAGYVGGDVVADVLASGMHLSNKLTLLIDVGTNGEIVLGKKDWMVSCSCSAGPAFEGGEVSCGMRAMDGAIDKMRVDDDLSTAYHVIGERTPVGICGSGLIDLVAEMYCKGIVDRKARIQDLRTDRVRQADSGREYVVERKQRLGGAAVSDLVINDADLQNLLRTKAAIFGACSTLLRKMGESLDNVSSIVIAGGFGYHLDVARAIMIGMFPDVSVEKYRYVGNGSLGGARMALLSAKKRKEMNEIFNKMTYLELSVDSDFYTEFSSSLFIPHTDISRFPSAPPERACKEARI